MYIHNYLIKWAKDCMEIISERIRDFNSDRIPKMVQLKYEFMKENLFRFYRGTNHIFYEDLSGEKGFPESPCAWICGDLHLENFGTYKSDNRQVYFDLNDFDEAVLAPSLWEVVRMATSIFIAFDTLKIEENKALHMAQLFLKSLGEKFASGKPDYIERNTAKGIVCEFLTAVNKRKQKDILTKKTILKKNKLRILLDNPRHFKLDKKLKKDLAEHMQHWLKTDENSPYNYTVIDSVFRLAGTGSVGVKRYAILLKSSNDTGEKYMLVDMKQSVHSSLEPFSQLKQPKWNNEADRIVTIQERMQNRAPALLSTSIFKNEAYVMQEMQPTKDSINFKLIKKEYRNIYQVIDDMAMLTASSQIRSSGRQGSSNADELIKLGERKDWQEGILQYAINYSHTVRKNYILFLKDYKEGMFRQK
jgi:uncharacterized protein (DUF2252 family)